MSRSSDLSSKASPSLSTVVPSPPSLVEPPPVPSCCPQRLCLPPSWPLDLYNVQGQTQTLHCSGLPSASLSSPSSLPSAPPTGWLVPCAPASPSHRLRSPCQCHPLTPQEVSCACRFFPLMARSTICSIMSVISIFVSLTNLRACKDLVVSVATISQCHTCKECPLNE